ncbi:MAG TPA: proline--tRNA ligase, partial [Pyrinomonadaceae bacterium]|nr:proline--tRNA ligase [Pyrinomonadaceae bacterium]
MSHRLLVRAGFVRQLAAGLYSLLPLGQRTCQKVAGIVRQEMDKIGAQEFLLPALLPAEVWKASGRWEGIGDEMFRLKDRGGADLCLGMTHEEVFTTIARHEIRSYKQLPQVWYQIQTKFRDEERPKSGLMRLRQFIMKDAYTFDVDRAGLDKSFDDQRGAYQRIFDRCGLKYYVVEASSGAMGGSESNEFMARTSAGEDFIANCAVCGYSANLEKATSRLAAIEDESGPDAPEEFPTPGVRTIEDLTTFPGGAAADRQIKTLVYVATSATTQEQFQVLALLRGDHPLHETKLADAIGASAVRPAQAEEIQTLLGAGAGSLGGVGARDKASAAKQKVFIVADEALRGRRG